MEMDNGVNILLRVYQDEVARLSNELIVLKAEIMLMQNKGKEEEKKEEVELLEDNN